MIMSHTDVLAGINETVKNVTSRILATWKLASDAEKEAGARWYGEAWCFRRVDEQ